MPALPKSATPSVVGKKKESKWGKVATNEPSAIPVPFDQNSTKGEKPELSLSNAGASLELS